MRQLKTFLFLVLVFGFVEYSRGTTIVLMTRSGFTYSDIQNTLIDDSTAVFSFYSGRLDNNGKVRLTPFVVPIDSIASLEVTYDDHLRDFGFQPAEKNIVRGFIASIPGAYCGMLPGVGGVVAGYHLINSVVPLGPDEILFAPGFVAGAISGIYIGTRVFNYFTNHHLGYPCEIFDLSGLSSREKAQIIAEATKSLDAGNHNQ